MTPPTPPLGDQFASLRVAFAASPHGGWLPPALHALISACLARIFGRLEQLLMLWQAGNFAPLPARPHAVNPCETRNPRVLPSDARQRMQPRDHRAALAATTSAPNRAAPPHRSIPNRSIPGHGIRTLAPAPARGA